MRQSISAIILCCKCIIINLCAESFAFDENGRLTTEVRSVGSNVSYSYDSAGNLASMAAFATGPRLVGVAGVWGQIGRPFSHTLVATAAPASFTASGLPPGLTFSGNAIIGTPTREGIYPATVTVTSGQASSSVPVTIQIRPAASIPKILRDPTAASVTLGQSITLSADIDGSSPLFFQWRKNGSPLPGATNLSYFVPTFAATDAGDYTLTVTNTAGEATTAMARLSQNRPLAISGQAFGLPITFSGTPAWFSQSNITWDGRPALQSGAIGNNASTSFQTTATGPGVFFWRWKVSSEPDNDGIVFRLDGVAQAVLTGERDWQAAGWLIGPGNHALTWVFTKDGNLVGGQDAGWIADAFLLSGWFVDGKVSGNGSIARRPELAVYPAGSSAELTATPEAGYYFAGWTGDATGTANPITLAMTAHRNVTAVFKENLAPALGASELPWTTGGDSDWRSQFYVTKNEGIAAQSGPLAANQSSWVETKVVGPGTLSWWWKVSSENGFDKLTIAINSVTVTNISGEVDWQQRSMAIPSGNQTIRWTYAKDARTEAGQDAAWLDAIVFQPVVSQPVNLAVTIGGGVLKLTWPVSAQGYQLQSTPSVALPASWKPLNIAPVVSGTEQQVSVPLSLETEFFRLLRP